MHHQCLSLVGTGGRTEDRRIGMNRKMRGGKKKSIGRDQGTRKMRDWKNRKEEKVGQKKNGEVSILESLLI